MSRFSWFSRFRIRWCRSRRGGLSCLRLTMLHLICNSDPFTSPIWVPYWAPKSVTNISLILLVWFNTLQLATGATGLWSQGATAVVHGCSIHALGPILGETTLLVDWAPSTALSNLQMEGCDNHTVIRNVQVQRLNTWHTGHSSHNHKNTERTWKSGIAEKLWNAKTYVMTIVSTLLSDINVQVLYSWQFTQAKQIYLKSYTTSSYRLNKQEGSGLTTLPNKGKCPECSKSQIEPIETLPTAVQEEGCKSHCTPLPEKFLLCTTGT